MKYHKYKNLIIDYLAKTISKKDEAVLNDHLSSCEECKNDVNDLQETEKQAEGYFQSSEISYDQTMESRIVENILSEKHTVWSKLKELRYKYEPIIRPAVMITTMLAFLLFGTMGYQKYQRIQIIKAVASTISINNESLDFVLFNNIDHIIQMYLQDDHGYSSMGSSEIYSGIKFSLSIYLGTQLNEEYIEENWKIIDSTLDQFTEKYLEYIKDNREEMLI